MTDVSLSGREFHRQLLLNLIEFCPRELYVFKMMLSRAGVMYMDHIILDKIIGKYGWQFVLVINTVMNKFQNLISMKLRKSEYIKICIKFDNRSVTWCIFNIRNNLLLGINNLFR